MFCTSLRLAVEMLVRPVDAVERLPNELLDMFHIRLYLYTFDLRRTLSTGLGMATGTERVEIAVLPVLTDAASSGWSGLSCRAMTVRSCADMMRFDSRMSTITEQRCFMQPTASAWLVLRLLVHTSP